MALIFPTPLLVVNTFAVLLGQAPGNAAFVEHQSYVTALGANGYKAALDNLFKDVPTSQLAANMRTNLGLTNVFTQAECEAFLDSFPGNRVGAMLLLADVLYNLVTTDPNGLAIKTAYVSSVDASYEYSLKTENPSSVDLTSLVATSQSFILKADADNLVGTSGDDTFSSIFSSSSTSSNTLSGGDSIDGAGGTGDKLTIRVIDTATGGSSVAPQSSNVEKFYITNLGTSTNNFFALDFQSITGETEVGSKGSLAGSETRALRVDSMAASIDTAEGSLLVNIKGTRTGATDAFSLSLNGAGTATSPAFFSTITTSGAVDNSFEIANISSTSTMSNVSLGVGQMTLKTVMVSGDAALKLGAHSNFVGLSMVDASAMTAGGLNIDARGSEESNFMFKGTPAVDRVVLKNSTINTASSLDGGAGKNTLGSENFGNLTASAVNKAVGFQVLEGVGGTENLDASSFTGINEFLFTGTAGSNNGFSFSNIESNDRFALSSDITSGGNRALQVEGRNAGNSALVELRAIDEQDGETVLTATSNNNDRFGIDIRSNIASLTLDSTGTGTGTKANVIETNQNNNFFGYAFGNSSTPVFKITGSHDVAIMAREGVDISDGKKLAGFSDAANVDASAFTGVLRIAGSLSNDVIMGGSGPDIIYGLGGADRLTGNGGADQFRLAKFYNATDTITDFIKGTDKVGLNEFDFSATTATSAGAPLLVADYVDNRTGITSIGNADAKKVIELQASLDSGQIQSDNGAAVEAYVLVHNTTTGKAELWYDSNWSNGGSRSHIITFENIVDLAGVKGFTSSDFVEYAF
jgi:hypothetical protein